MQSEVECAKACDAEEDPVHTSVVEDDEEDACSFVDSDISASDAMFSHLEEDKKEIPTIARAETRAVRSLKLMVLLVLVLSSIGVALAVYFYTYNAEQVQFKVAFADDSRKVLEALGRSLERTLGAVDAYSSSFVSNARSSNQTWPFVAIDDFAVRTEKIRQLTVAVTVSIHPLVTPHNRLKWESYAKVNSGWANETMKVMSTNEFYYGDIMYNYSTRDVIHNDFYVIPYNSTRPMLPVWQNTPFSPRWPVYNWDLLSQEFPEPIYHSLETHNVVLSEPYNLPDPNVPDEVAETEAFVDWFSDYVAPGQNPGEPASDIYVPILDHNFDTIRISDDTEDRPKLVGLMMIIIYWRDLIKDILPRGSNGVVVVFENECSPTFTYRLDGPAVLFLGRGDLHETKYESLGVASMLNDVSDFYISGSKYTGIPLDQAYCPFRIRVFPSTIMEADYATSNPVYFTIASLLIFAFTSAVFILYDCFVERRQRKVMTNVVRSNQIIASLFPSVVRDRIYLTEETQLDASTSKHTVFKLANSKTRLKSFLSDGTTSGDDDTTGAGSTPRQGSPIAELFPETTVMFADIVGFTAWSSVRDPSQVFSLLETIYGAFDSIARRRGVFKVETIGDSYVAVCGLPEPRADHAVVMARFARDCRESMAELTRRLEKSLGPDTGDLKMRFGLHSGPVTAGVLRGERARFQLFGDTVNCAARMESTSLPNVIQVSQKTADLLDEAGKGYWLTEREDLVDAKGKGMLQTFFVNPPSRNGSSGIEGGTNSESTTADVDVQHVLGMSSTTNTSAAKMERLIDWNLDSMKFLLKQVVSRRQAALPSKNQKLKASVNWNANKIAWSARPRSEVSEVIALPDFEFKASSRKDMLDIDISDEVVWQLRDIISVIAYSYRNNAFHNFEHASHVAMSTMKLLQRVVSPEVYLSNVSKNERKVAEALASNLHHSTFGITSDPLTQFAIVFSALVHDMDHPGVSNLQLVTERDPLAQAYENESVAEQHSIAIAWELLMRPGYEELRQCLFDSEGELHRFRQLIVNSVMATDIFDKDLKTMRELRWEKAFKEDANLLAPHSISMSLEDLNRKATIVIEHLIQASDVAHTMQHWTIYTKWNKRLFEEMYVAYQAGRSVMNPAVGWYQGELWFFDHYIIPLARKLRECGVFGVSCDEFLNYARDNRMEWEGKGRDLVQQMLEEARSKYGTLEEPPQQINPRSFEVDEPQGNSVEDKPTGPADASEASETAEESQSSRLLT